MQLSIGRSCGRNQGQEEVIAQRPNHEPWARKQRSESASCFSGVRSIGHRFPGAGGRRMAPVTEGRLQMTHASVHQIIG